MLMRKTIQTLLWISVSVGLSFIILSYTNDGNDFSMAQQQAQNDAQDQTQLSMSQSKFLKNSTSFGNATADLKIKHAPEFSTLTIQPWPMVEPNKEFNITGMLVDKITLQPIPSSDVTFLYESASEAIQPSSLKQIDNQNTDATGKFSTTTNAPDTEGIISVTAVFDGSGLYHSGASDPALVIVSNSALPP
jgi:hypothetical protein